MADGREFTNASLEALIELLDIPDGHYALAAARYKSLGEWLRRKESRVLKYEPDVHPQGSFRYGTVIRPLLPTDEYDLDLVCELARLAKDQITQQALKQLVGAEIIDYATAHAFQSRPEERKRCWRVEYSDQVNFHMDILPSIPDSKELKAKLLMAGVEPSLADLAIAITDTTHPNYRQIAPDWPSSNPRGYAQWFEAKVRMVKTARVGMLLEKRAYASIEQVPAFEWKGPLQRAIQLLKRHRDVMFRDDPEGKPISMIITTLAAKIYRGEPDVAEALEAVVNGIPAKVSMQKPRIPNPVNPAEDFADKWAKDPRLEQNFWLWQTQVKKDIEALTAGLTESQLRAFARNKFGLDLSEEKASQLTRLDYPKPSYQPPLVTIKTGQQPWSGNG